MEVKESLKQENERLKKELEIYKESPSAKFYKALVIGVEKLTTSIEDGSLDLTNNPFADSLFKIAKEGDKIIASLAKGQENFLVKKEEDNREQKSTHKKSTTEAF